MRQQVGRERKPTAGTCLSIMVRVVRVVDEIIGQSEVNSES
jgi:hypothetical protein